MTIHAIIIIGRWPNTNNCMKIFSVDQSIAVLKDLRSKQNRTGSKREHLIKQYVEHIDLIIQVYIYMTIFYNVITVP